MKVYHAIKGIAGILSKFGLTFQVIKTALATGIAWWAATALTPNPYPFFAPIAAVLVVNATVAESLEKAFYRIIGTIGGVLVSLFIGHWLHVGTIAIFLSVLLGMVLATALSLNTQITAQIGVNSMLVLAFLHSPGYALGRIYETMLGCIIAIIVNAVIIPPNAIPKASKSIDDLSRLSFISLNNLGALWYQDDPNMKEDLKAVRYLVDQTENTFDAVKLAKQSIRFRPFAKKKKQRIKELAVALSRLEHITIQIRGIARGLVDLRSVKGLTVNVIGKKEAISAMKATAVCIHLYGKSIVNPSEKISKELNEAIAKARIKQKYCLTTLYQSTSLTVFRDIGGILTDLNRIIKEVSGERLVKTGREY
ncbi:FUSC family protein [Scopulibacillus cellulosilyticus]|uniref:Aromatic acid exporter family protein n=1 Tax=Scopulibacillus cellulosilyticus TaxID=2665665 RepID=A0ABW2PVG4_9BACL